MHSIASRDADRLYAKDQLGRASLYQLEPLLVRMLDIFAGMFGLVLLSPLFLAIAILIKRDSEGPIFYHGLRAGREGKPFHILKFRTMYERPESYDGPRITGNGDKRVTPIGQWLRDTKLNELPQLWNVLRGEMSLVGPRPEDPLYVDQWSEEMRRVLLTVKPGITSPASIVFRNEEELLDSGNLENVYMREILPSKLRLDSIYLRRRSILSDLDIIVWTIITLLPSLRERRIPDQLLYWGPLSRLTSRYFSWFAVDTLVAMASMFIAGLLWFYTAPADTGFAADIGLATAVVILIVVALVFSTVNAAFGLTRIVWSRASSRYVLPLLRSSVLATAILLLINSQMTVKMPAGLLVLSGALAWLGFVAARYRTRLLSAGARQWLRLRPSASATGERVLIIGSGNVGCFAASMFKAGVLNRAFSVVGMVDDDPRLVGREISECRILGVTADIRDLVSRYDIDVLVVAVTQLSSDEREGIVTRCRETSARMIYLPEIVANLNARFQSGQDQTEGLPHLERLQEKLIQLDRLLQEEDVHQARKIIQEYQAELEISPCDRPTAFVH